MENAARAVVDVAVEMLGPTGSVLILCGGGNNGGDGLAVARHLHNRGYEVTIGLTIDPAKYSGDALINWRIVEAMKLPVVTASPQWIAEQSADLIIDAIFGTGLTQPPRPPFAEIVRALEGRRILSVDLPSGLDCDTGEPLGPCVTAEATITFVAQKAGFANTRALEFTGKVTVGDIGCPTELLA